MVAVPLLLVLVLEATVAVGVAGVVVEEATEEGCMRALH